MPAPERTPVEAPQHFPFDLEFQKSLLRILCENDHVSTTLRRFIEPAYFENEVLAWAWSYCVRHYEEYATMPSVGVILQQTRAMDPKVRPIYSTVIAQVRTAELRDEQWIIDKTLDFVKRNIFATTFRDSRDLYNSGKTSKAYDLMMERMDALSNVRVEPIDRQYFFEEFTKRVSERMRNDPTEAAVPTGLNFLDQILDGGLSPGELGIWLAYAKTGKSTMLVNHGVVATSLCWRNTLHLIFEGNGKQLANRYDAAFTQELYSNIKRGEIDDKRYSAALAEYNMLKGRLVLRAMTDKWEYSVPDIQEEIRELRRSRGWEPSLLIVDYGDLLNGRDKSYRTEYDRQKAAYRDLKMLASRGYAVWTASQARRPKSGEEDTPNELSSSDIADSYEKVRVADFLGSLNCTPLEREHKVMRIYAELYRDNAAHKTKVVQSDFQTMRITEKSGLRSPSKPDTPTESTFVPKQVKANL